MNSRSQRDELIEEHTVFVRRVVIKTARVLGLPQKNVDEYIAAGLLGLVEAAERFEPRDGVTFKSYAYLRVRGAVIDFIREHSELKGKAYRYARALRSLDDVEQEGMRSLSGKSQDKQLTLAKIFEFAARGAMTFRLSSSDSELALEAIPHEDKNPEELLVEAEYAHALKKCISALPEKERFIVEQHYYHGKSFKELTVERPELSKSWVSRLHTRALSELSRMMEGTIREAA